jgi:hypothetical protein
MPLPIKRMSAHLRRHRLRAPRPAGGRSNFGILEVCQCQKENYQRASVQRLYQVSNLQAFKDMTFEGFDVCGHDNQGKPTKPWNSPLTPPKIMPAI